MKNNKTLIWTSLVCLIPLIAGAVLYSRLPETVATHWDMNGAANGWSSRAFAAFGLPGILLAVNLFVPFALRTDPKRQNMSPALVSVAQWTVPVVSLLGSGLTLARALGYQVRVEKIVPALIGVLFIIIGNFLPKTKQSDTMGSKLPWTLASEENWNRTHRLAGFVWVIGGVYFVVMSFFSWTLAGFLIPVALLGLIPAAYSYILYRRGI